MERVKHVNQKVTANMQYGHEFNASHAGSDEGHCCFSNR